MQTTKATLVVQVALYGQSAADLQKVRNKIPAWVIQSDETAVEEENGVFKQTFQMFRRACWGNWASDAKKNLVAAIHYSGCPVTAEISNPRRAILGQRAAKQRVPGAKVKMADTVRIIKNDDVIADSVIDDIPDVMILTPAEAVDDDEFDQPVGVMEEEVE